MSVTAKTVKLSYVPKSFAVALGLASLHEGNGKGETGRPVQVYSKERAANFIAKQLQGDKDVQITELNRTGGDGVKLSTFLKLAAEKSEEQGYLSMENLKDCAGLTAVSPSAGHPAFKSLVNKLILGDFIALDRGRKAGSSAQDDSGIDYSDF